jgi:hypothetical protein
LNVNGNVNVSGLITANGIIETNTTTTVIDVFTMQYDTTNSIRFRQRYVSPNNIHYDLVHKLTNVDKPTLYTFSNGYVGMRTTTPYAKLHITQGSTTAAECIPLKICSGSYDGNTIELN